MATLSRALAIPIAVVSISGAPLEGPPPMPAAQAELPSIRASWIEIVAMIALRFNGIPELRCGV